MKTFTFNSAYGSYDVTINKRRFATKLEHYRYDLIDTEDGRPIATCNVNIDGLEEGELAIKDYSENEGMLEFLTENNLVEKPHRYASSGYVTIPVCKAKELINL